VSNPESIDLVALVGCAYALELRRGGTDWSAFQSVQHVLAEVEPENASPVQGFALIVEAVERFGAMLLYWKSDGGAKG